MTQHYVNDSATAAWLKLCADEEHGQVVTDAVVISQDTAREIDLSGIRRMTRAEIEQALCDVEAA